MDVHHSLSFFLSPAATEFFADRKVGVTIGNFDGMHIGHQALFSELHAKLGRASGAHVTEHPPLRVLLTFAPHPRQVLTGVTWTELPKHPEFWSLTPFRTKAQLAESFGFDVFFIVPFSHDFASLTPHEFIHTYLIRALRADVVVVGHDWAFGKSRTGGIESLQEAGSTGGFSVYVVPPVTIGELRVSSTAVKEALKNGDVDQLQVLLGRNFAVEGRVRRGDSRGRQLGYPTANLKFRSQILPADGVYISLVKLAGEEHPAVTSIGLRPTFGQNERNVETFILSGDYDLYGKRIEVTFLKRLRGEIRFDSVPQLIAAMDQDVSQAKEFFAS